MASALWTLGTVAALWLALRLRARPWIAFLLWLVPTLVLFLDFERQTVSAHGLLHASIVYDILERGAPPGHPLLGGETLRYPWAHHWIVAVAARLFGATPAAAFGATGILSLALFGFLLDRAAREIHEDVRYRILAVALALFGPNPFSYGPLASALARSLILYASAALEVFAFGFITPLVAYKFLMASLLPLGMRMGSAVTEGWPASQPLTRQGAYLEPLDPAERDLCRWIASHTPREALFVDDRLTVPPFGRRRLFVGLPQEAPLPGTHEG
jgi:hypothetical protein